MTATPSESTGVPPVVMRRLSEAYQRVPKQFVVVQEWESDEGQDFWRRVRFAVANGVTPEEIGVALGITNFMMRYTIYGK